MDLCNHSCLESRAQAAADRDVQYTAIESESCYTTILSNLYVATRTCIQHRINYWDIAFPIFRLSHLVPSLRETAAEINTRRRDGLSITSRCPGLTDLCKILAHHL